MTLILGYIHSDSSIHLVSDSAETWETSNPEQVFPQKGGFTSFGDAIVFDESTVIEESAQKIYQINESILIGFSGNVLEGKGVIDDLIIKLSESHNDDVLAILQIYFDQNIPQKSQFIIAFQEKEYGGIFIYDKQGIFLNKPGGHYIIGKGRELDLIAGPLQHILEYLFKRGLSSMDHLTSLIATLQSFSLNSRAIKSGVGGFYNGALILNNQVHWSIDTCYLLFSSRHYYKGERFIVNKFNRDGATFITSSKFKRTVFIPNIGWNKDKIDKWIDKWLETLNDLNTGCLASYYAFISYDRRVILIVKKPSNAFDKHLNFKQSEQNERIMNITFSIELHKMLNEYAVSAKSGKESPNGFGVVYRLLGK